jgi:O-antigen ligase
MFRERPLLGWGQGEFAREIQSRMSDFRPGAYAAHNTFVDILVEHGTVGLLLYIWIAVNLFRLGKNRSGCSSSGRSASACISLMRAV